MKQFDGSTIAFLCSWHLILSWIHEGLLTSAYKRISERLMYLEET